MAGMSSFPLTKSIIFHRGRSTTNQMTMVLFYTRIHGFLSNNRCFFFQMAGLQVFPNMTCLQRSGYNERKRDFNNWLLVHRTWYNCITLGCKQKYTSHGVMMVVQAYLRPLRPLLFDVICWLTPATIVISPVVTLLVGGLEHGFYDFPFILGMSSSQLTNSYFFRGVETTNQFR